MQQRSTSSSATAASVAAGSAGQTTGAGAAGYYSIASASAGMRGAQLPGGQRRAADPNDFPALSQNSSISGPPLTPGGSGSSYAQLAQAQAQAQAQHQHHQQQQHHHQQQHQQQGGPPNPSAGNALPQPPPGLQGYTVGGGQQPSSTSQQQMNGSMQSHQSNGESGAGRGEDFPALGGMHGIGGGEGKDVNGRSLHSGKVNPSPLVRHNGPGASPPNSTQVVHAQPAQQHLQHQQQQQHPPLQQPSTSSTSSHLYPSEPPAGSSWPQQRPPQQQPPLPQQQQDHASRTPSSQHHDPSIPLTKPAQQLVTSPADKWGLAALLRLIRTGGRDDQLALGLGEDLANIGLDMNGSAPLYPTFIAPWAEPEAIRGVFLEDEFRIPQCYNVNTPPVSSKIALFSDETLFYAFYSSPRDVLQMEVAAELYARQWRYHKELGVWLTKDPAAEPIEKGANYERGTYIIFDPAVFSRVETQKDFTLSYEMLEDRPIMVGQQAGTVPPPPPQQGGTTGAVQGAGSGSTGNGAEQQASPQRQVASTVR